MSAATTEKKSPRKNGKPRRESPPPEIGGEEPAQAPAAEPAGAAAVAPVTPPAEPPSFMSQLIAGFDGLVQAARLNRAKRDQSLAEAAEAEAVVRDALGMQMDFVAAYKAEAGLGQPATPGPAARKTRRGRQPGRPPGRPPGRVVRQNSNGGPTNKELIRTLARRRANRVFTTQEVGRMFKEKNRSAPGTVLTEMRRGGEIEQVQRGEWKLVKDVAE